MKGFLKFMVKPVLFTASIYFLIWLGFFDDRAGSVITGCALFLWAFWGVAKTIAHSLHRFWRICTIISFLWMCVALPWIVCYAPKDADVNRLTRYAVLPLIITARMAYRYVPESPPKDEE